MHAVDTDTVPFYDVTQFFQLSHGIMAYLFSIMKNKKTMVQLMFCFN